jgi:hypothetical protein
LVQLVQEPDKGYSSSVVLSSWFACGRHIIGELSASSRNQPWKGLSLQGQQDSMM